MKPLPEAVQRAFPCAPDRLPERPWRTDMTPAKAAAHDAAYPLPHPGYRVGQTWAVNVTATDAAVFTITEYDVDHIELTGRAPAGHATGKAQPWHAGGAWITDAELRDLCRDGYLLADAVCPHLAPWSPCEVKP